MNLANNPRLVVTKAVLWLVLGIATAVAVARYIRGLGATTALTDVNPWGLWIGFDVLSGVALAAGGFVIAATVYIFRLERYHALVRPAVLTAFLGYVAVALGLMVDLGRPWNIWRMMFFWQPHSPLFEVGWCVMLYLTVLALEFAPVVFEGLKWQRAFAFVRRLTLPLVIAGIALSTLHQSSLGTLFLLARDRMHPLWYSPMLPALFFVSAIGLGLAMVTTEASITSWLYRRPPEWPLLRGLTRAAAVVLSLYLILRIGDLAWRAQLHHALDGTWASLLFLVELTMSAVVPILLFVLPATRSKGWAVTTGAGLAVAGFVLHRADVGGIAHIPVTGQPYLPALTEIVVSCGLVSAMALIFLFFVERLPVWEEPPSLPDHFTPPMVEPVSRAYFGGSWFSRSNLAAASWTIGMVLGVVLLEWTTAGGAAPQPQPVQGVRSTAAVRTTTEGSPGAWLERYAGPVAEGELPEGFATVLLIDGDRSGRATVFDHRGHQGRLGGELSCGRCHHRNLRGDRGTPCSTCHRDMYRTTDVFGHQQHVRAEGGNSSCARCHRDPSLGRSRATAVSCSECHAADVSRDFVLSSSPSPGLVPGMAVGYREAMHRLCITCHLRHEASTALESPYWSRCTTCHHAGAEAPAPAPAPAALPVRVASLGVG